MAAFSIGDRKENFVKGVVLATLGIRNDLSTIIPHAPSTPNHLNCGACCGVLVEPVCFPCGHSLCKSCGERLVHRCTGNSVICCPTVTCHREHKWFMDKQVLKPLCSYARKWPRPSLVTSKFVIPRKEI